MSLEGKSKVICVAGSSGSVGHHICEELLIANEGFKVVLLLRKENDELIRSLHATTCTSGKNDNLFYEIVDFNDSNSLQDTLKKHKCDTIISALSSFDGTHLPVENSILEAALAVGHVRRFMPSIYGMPAERMTWNAYDPIKAMQAKFRKLHEQKRISWVFMFNGFFMNYFAFNATPRADQHLPGTKEVRPGTGFLTPLPLAFDTNTHTATIPGTGDEPFVITTVQDTARFVATICALESEWHEENGYVVGDITTYNKMKKIFESTFGTEFVATYKSRQELEEREKETLDPVTTMLVQVDLMTVRLDCVWENSLKNAIKFKPTSVEQFIKEWWP